MHRVRLCLFLCSSLTACTVGIVKQEVLTPGTSVLPTPNTDPASVLSSPTPSLAKTKPLVTPTREATIPPTISVPTEQLQDTVGLNYYWPLWLPHGLRVDACASSVEDNGFLFGANTSGMNLTIAGGSGVHWVSYLPPCSDNYESVRCAASRVA